MTSIYHEFLALSKKEGETIDQLIHLLAEEKEALIQRQFDKLEAFSTEKQRLSEIIETTTQQRLLLLGTNVTPDNYHQALQSFLAQCPPTEARQIQAENQVLMEKITYCRDANSVNGQVISVNLNTRQAMLQELLGSNPSNAIGTYTAAGNLTQEQPAKRHQEA